MVIKRRGNLVMVTAILATGHLSQADRVYWLAGYTEELLSHLLKQPVKLEIQTIDSNDELIVKWI